MLDLTCNTSRQTDLSIKQEITYMHVNDCPLSNNVSARRCVCTSRAACREKAC